MKKKKNKNKAVKRVFLLLVLLVFVGLGYYVKDSGVVDEQAILNMIYGEPETAEVIDVEGELQAKMSEAGLTDDKADKEAEEKKKKQEEAQKAAQEEAQKAWDAQNQKNSEEMLENAEEEADDENTDKDDKSKDKSDKDDKSKDKSDKDDKSKNKSDKDDKSKDKSDKDDTSKDKSDKDGKAEDEEDIEEAAVQVTAATHAVVRKKAEEDTQTTGKNYEFRNDKRLAEHYEKHGIEMGFETAEEYRQAAVEVVNSSESMCKTEKEDGDYVYYRERTNELVIVSKDGYLRTYFKPDGGRAYFDRQ